MLGFLVELLPGIITAIVASYLTSRWSLARFYSERWWERKEKAYAEIIEALYDLLQYCEIKKEDYGGGAKYSEVRMEELSTRYTQAFWKIKKATDIGAFVVSPEADDVLKGLQDRPRLDWERNPLWDIYEQDYMYYREALTKIVAIARSDLKATMSSR